MQQSEILRDQLKTLQLKNNDGVTYQVQGQGGDNALIPKNIKSHTAMVQVRRTSDQANRESFKSK